MRGERAAAGEEQEEKELMVGEQRELVKCLQANTPHHQHNTGKAKKREECNGE